MAEPLGVAALALEIFNLFHSIARDFLLLHAVKDSRNNIQTNLALLSSAQLQLTRWGLAVGLNVEDPQSDQFDKLIPAENRQQAREYLDSMHTALQEARTRATRYNAPKEDKLGPSGDTSVPAIVAEKDVEALTGKVRSLILSRVKKSSTSYNKLVTGTRWAIYDKAIFKELLEDITNLMKSLEILFPSSEQARKILAAEEIEQLTEQVMRKLMERVTEWKADQDIVMQDLLGELEEKEESSGGSWSVSVGAYNDGLVIGRDGSGNVINNYRPK